MICLLLIMTMIFINGTESAAAQKVRHSDTLLKEEETNAKTKAWLLMVESGKVDQEELRRITPKSIFIAPLLTSRAGKCKEGFRHDHLGQCVKVIKIDPQVQLELLLQKLNKLYGDKKEEEEEEREEREELFEVSSGPLHFSLPISNAEEKAGQTTSEAKPQAQQVPSTTANATASDEQNATEFIPIPLLHRNQTNQTKEIESSGSEPLNETDAQEASRFEGSGDGRPGSGDGFPEEEPTTPSRVSLLPEESLDYLDATEPESTPFAETPSATEAPEEAFATPKATLDQPLPKGSYQNVTDASGVNNANESSPVFPKENPKTREETIVKSDSDSERIYFPSEEDDYDDGSRTSSKPPVFGSRIRFPDEPLPERQPPSRVSPPDSGTKSARYQTHSSAISREQFWWLPKNWQIDENQHKSALVKVWSRLPLIHDVAYSRETAEDFKKPLPTEEEPPPGRGDEESSSRPAQQQTSRIVKPFKSSRFQDILMTPRQNFRFQR